MKIIACVLLTSPVICIADEVQERVWEAIPGYTLWDIYTNGGSEQTIVDRQTKIVSSSGQSWPDGRQAMITYLEVTQKKLKWLYRCVDFTNKDFQSTGNMCYELRDPKRKQESKSP